MIKKYNNQFEARKTKVRAKLKKVSDRPRLSVFRSNKHIYGQIIDDKKRKTLAAASDGEISAKSPRHQGSAGQADKIKIAHKVGELLAKRAKKKKIKEVYFDRGGYKYHGRVKAFAEGVRKGGLKL